MVVKLRLRLAAAAAAATAAAATAAGAAAATAAAARARHNEVCCAKVPAPGRLNLQAGLCWLEAGVCVYCIRVFGRTRSLCPSAGSRHCSSLSQRSNATAHLINDAGNVPGSPAAPLAPG